MNRDYRTGDGLHGESTYEDALKYGYRPYMQNEAVRIFDCNGEASAFLEQLDRSYNQPPEDTFIGMIALAMEVEKIQSGEIDCFVMHAVSFYYEEKKGFLPLEIHVYTKTENIEHWDESWGVNIQ